MAYTKRSSGWNDVHSWFSVGMIARNGAVAALYFVLSVTAFWMSFGMIQFRLSEILNILVFFNPAYTIGLTLGCLLSNIVGASIGMASWWDLLIGTGCTLLACLLMIPFRQLFLASLMPVIINGVGVGLELYYLFGLSETTPLWVCMGWVALGEVIMVPVIGYVLGHVFKRFTPSFLENIIGATRNMNFVW